ncbi:uncharacterized protein DFL_004375 [Arthrobotrys flagrans]|uniref:Uncharacterized protein n=1 Tax=Arthrobotrys flagrans TaxID=97331 RepID=A0A437A4H3_ARTFL|nr:hypothetical protein DFL_004375 [Arthrobotrys flagrans]
MWSMFTPASNFKGSSLFRGMHCYRQELGELPRHHNAISGRYSIAISEFERRNLDPYLWNKIRSIWSPRITNEELQIQPLGYNAWGSG